MIGDFLRKYHLPVIISAVIIGIISFNLLWTNSKTSPKEQFITCVANHTQTLYFMDGCSACNRQKKVLKPYLDKFNVIYCNRNGSICKENNILAVPYWDFEQHPHRIGVLDREKLMNITNCSLKRNT